MTVRGELYRGEGKIILEARVKSDLGKGKSSKDGGKSG